jgi:hypothetical protein
MGPAGTAPTCSAAHVCTYPCDSSHHMCSDGTCIANANCCSDNDCPPDKPACDGTRTCVKRANGATCATDTECVSGTCPSCYRDKDGDGFGDKWGQPLAKVCGSCVPGYVPDNRDCLDDPNVFQYANNVNPNAVFHPPANTAPPGLGGMYVPDPRDPTPDGWDWNCDGARTLSITTFSPGCAAGATCSNGCTAAAPAAVGTDSCGTFVIGSACLTDMCAMIGACISPTNFDSPQNCK